jgi:hypothetical protein
VKGVGEREMCVWERWERERYVSPEDKFIFDILNIYRGTRKKRSKHP